MACIFLLLIRPFASYSAWQTGVRHALWCWRVCPLHAGYSQCTDLLNKLLCVPLLNLSVIVIDRMVRSIDSEAALNLWKGPSYEGRGNLAHMSVWILVFGLMSFIGKTDGKHTGDSLPFWRQACADNSCERLVQLQSTYCGDNAGWACNELGILPRRRVVEKDGTGQRLFSQSCELRFQAGCLNLLAEDRFASADLNPGPPPAVARRQPQPPGVVGNRPLLELASTTGPLPAVKVDLIG